MLCWYECRATGYVTGPNIDAFMKDERTQDAVIRSIEIMGEAANCCIDRWAKRIVAQCRY